MGRVDRTNGEKGNAYEILVENAEGRRPPRRSRRRWVGNVEMDIREIVCVGMDWVNLDQDRNQWRVVVNTIMRCWVP